MSCGSVETTRDDLLFGALSMRQPVRGPRITVDSILLAAFARLKRGERALELGSAAGVVSLLLAWRFPHVHVDGLEIQEHLVELARENAEENGLAERTFFHAGDFRAIRTRFAPESFDVVVTNPPYDEEGRSRKSPVAEEALARHGVACTLPDVIAAAGWALPTRGRLFAIFRSDRCAELFCALNEAGLEPKRLRAVHPRPGRRAAMVLVQAMKGARAGIIVEPPLFIADETGAYTPELLQAYTKEGLPCL